MDTPDWIKRIKTPIVSKNRTIPIYAPLLTEKEKSYVTDSITSTWISSKGKYVRLFEQAFASYCDVPYAVSCSSGTAALFLALKLMNIKEDDEVIIPTFTMISTAFAVSYTGATPVFADCLPDSGNIDPDQIKRRITKKTKVVIPVHLYGNPCDMESITQIANKHEIRILEDAAQAMGATYRGKHVGGISDFSTFSLYVNKIVTTGEGGMLTLKSPLLYRKLLYMNNYEFSHVRHFWHKHIGYNFRLSSIQAAIGLGQMEHIEDTLKRKQRIARWYEKHLKTLRDCVIPYTTNPNGTGNFWHMAYRIPELYDNIMKLRNFLGQNGVETRGGFLPLHLQPTYRKQEYEGNFPCAERLSRTTILLPSGPTLSELDVERICRLIVDFFKHSYGKKRIQKNV